MTDNFIYDGKGKMTKTQMIMDAIEFGIKRETPKLKPNEKLKIVVSEDFDNKGVQVDVLRVGKGIQNAE